MHKLSLNTFLSGAHDLEARQYHVLDGLKLCFDAFAHNRLYPALLELVDLHAALVNIINNMNDIQDHFPQQLKEVDLEKGRLVYEQVNASDQDLERARDLILWALPKLEQAIDEGVDIYNFVDDHITIQHVGIVPMYREEGYWFVPEHRARLLHLLRYQVSLFTSENERYRRLKTSHIGEVSQRLVQSTPESIKLNLIALYNDLPNPATYCCETDLDFPYNETILPVAKRKLMAQVFS